MQQISGTSLQWHVRWQLCRPPSLLLQYPCTVLTFAVLCFTVVLQVGTSCRAQQIPGPGLQRHVHWQHRGPCSQSRYDSITWMAKCVLRVWQHGAGVV